MTLYEVFDRLELTWLGQLVADSTWLFPIIEAGHLLGLAALGGAILVVDLRLLGFGLSDKTAAYVLDQARPWMFGAVVAMFATGIPLFLSEAVKCYWSYAFWVKMGALAVALCFTFGLRNRLIDRQTDLSAWLSKGLGLGSLALWLTVAAAGRWIGFS
jgi:hypothetical protein